jgi:hypothetical protein
MFKVYKCICRKKHHSKKQMHNHKLHCQHRLYQKERFNRQVEDEQLVINRL